MGFFKQYLTIAKITLHCFVKITLHLAFLKVTFPQLFKFCLAHCCHNQGWALRTQNFLDLKALTWIDINCLLCIFIRLGSFGHYLKWIQTNNSYCHMISTWQNNLVEKNGMTRAKRMIKRNRNTFTIFRIVWRIQMQNRFRVNLKQTRKP